MPGFTGCYDHHDKDKKSANKTLYKEAKRWAKKCNEESRMDTSQPNSARAAFESDDAASSGDNEAPLLLTFDHAAPSGSGATTTPVSAATMPIFDPAAPSGSGATPSVSAATTSTTPLQHLWQATSMPTVVPMPRRQIVAAIDAHQVVAMLTSLAITDGNKSRELTRLGRENALLTQQVQASRRFTNVSPRMWTPELGDRIMEVLIDHINQAGSVELENLDSILTDDVVQMVSSMFNSAPLRE